MNTNFPIEVFPKTIQQFIKEGNESLNFPIGYLGAGVLYTSSLLIGNTYKVQVKPNWLESPILFLITVGKPGVNKTHSLNFCFSPIELIGKDLNRKNKEELMEYENLTKEEQLNTKQPMLKQIQIGDTTPEAIIHIHNQNPKGIGYYRDEILSWTKDFNRYSKGSEEQFWLSIFSNQPYTFNRVAAGAIRIESPFIPVIGSTQPDSLVEMFGGMRSKNGFIDRILLVFNDSGRKSHWLDKEVNDKTIDDYNNLMLRVNNKEIEIDDFGNIQHSIIKFDDEAKATFIEWYNQNVDTFNNEKTPSFMSGSISKSDIYCARLALILEVLNSTDNYVPISNVSNKSIQGAIKLINYFRNQASKAHNFLISNQLKNNYSKENYFNQLPVNFQRQDANGVALQIDLNLKTAEKYLEEFVRLELISKPKHNVYVKVKAQLL